MIQPRAYRPDDRAACLRVFDSNVPSSFLAHERTEYEAFLAELPGPYLVVEEDGVIVACGGYAIAPGTTTADLCWGMVRLDRQHRGLGRLLTEARLARIVTDPAVTRVSLKTAGHTRAFYERLGFRVQHVVPDGIAQGMDLCHMEWQVKR